MILMGSKGDEMVRKDFLTEYETIAGLSGAILPANPFLPNFVLLSDFPQNLLPTFCRQNYPQQSAQPDQDVPKQH